MVAPVPLRVHVLAKPECHSRAYALRVMADSTELLVADKKRKLNWIDSADVEVVEPEPAPEHASESAAPSS